MKIYAGKNKKESKEITLKLLLLELTNAKKCKTDCDRFSDDSSSWFAINKTSDVGQVSIELYFNPKNDNELVDFSVWETKYILDHENMKRIDK